MSDLKEFSKTINATIAKGVALSHLLRIMPEMKPVIHATIQKEADDEAEKLFALKMLDMIETSKEP